MYHHLRWMVFRRQGLPDPKKFEFIGNLHRYRLSFRENLHRYRLSFQENLHRYRLSFRKNLHRYRLSFRENLCQEAPRETTCTENLERYAEILENKSAEKRHQISKQNCHIILDFFLLYLMLCALKKHVENKAFG